MDSRSQKKSRMICLEISSEPSHVDTTWHDYTSSQDRKILQASKFMSCHVSHRSGNPAWRHHAPARTQGGYRSCWLSWNQSFSSPGSPDVRWRVDYHKGPSHEAEDWNTYGQISSICEIYVSMYFPCWIIELQATSRYARCNTSITYAASQYHVYTSYDIISWYCMLIYMSRLPVYTSMEAYDMYTRYILLYVYI